MHNIYLASIHLASGRKLEKPFDDRNDAAEWLAQKINEAHCKRIRMKAAEIRPVLVSAAETAYDWENPYSVRKCN